MSDTVSVSEWALIAEQLLAMLPVQGDAVTWMSATHARCTRRDGVRAFCNLMMTCRELYLDLPWAMPKWCLSDVLLTETAYNTFISRAACQRMLIVDWMDTFQPALVRVEEEEEEEEEEDDTSAGTSATPVSREVWLENRFLAYAWLGVTWDSRCPFLQAKLMTTPWTAGGFWSTFARCGRVHFAKLSAMDAWATATYDEQMDEEAVEEGQAAEGMEDTRDMNTAPPEQHKHQQQEQQYQQQHQQQPRRPAVFSLVATLHNQQQVDRWSALRDTALAGVRGSRVDLTVTAGLSSLAARDVNKLYLSTLEAAVDQVSFEKVAHVNWMTHETQRSIRGTFAGVERLVLNNAASVNDISVLAGIPAITLSWYSCPHQPVDLASPAGVDLSPLSSIKELSLIRVRFANEQQAFATAQQLKLSRVALRCDTLQAAHVKLHSLLTAPDVLHLPNATHIELVSTFRVKRVTCPARIDTLIIDDFSHTPPAIPEFEHAHKVDLNLNTPLTREQLADLGRRVDSLVLRGTTVAHMADLQDIPDDVHVQLMSVCVDGPVPTCVNALEVYLEGIDGYRGAWMSNVPNLLLPGLLQHRRVHDLHLLSGRKLLHLSECNFAGELSRCDRLDLSLCSGSVSVSRIESLIIEKAILGLSCSATADGSCAGRKTMARAREQLVVTGVRDVAHCRLQHCSIEAFAGCIEHVQRLILSRCTFDSVDDLPSVGSLVLRECTTEDKAWRWPDVVMTGRTPAEMAHVLMQGKERCEPRYWSW